MPSHKVGRTKKKRKPAARRSHKRGPKRGYKHTAVHNKHISEGLKRFHRNKGRR